MVMSMRRLPCLLLLHVRLQTLRTARTHGHSNNRAYIFAMHTDNHPFFVQAIAAYKRGKESLPKQVTRLTPADSSSVPASMASARATASNTIACCALLLLMFLFRHLVACGLRKATLLACEVLYWTQRHLDNVTPLGSYHDASMIGSISTSSMEAVQKAPRVPG